MQVMVEHLADGFAVRAVATVCAGLLGGVGAQQVVETEPAG
jgi:hypothetical protein